MGVRDGMRKNLGAGIVTGNEGGRCPPGMGNPEFQEAEGLRPNECCLFITGPHLVIDCEGSRREEKNEMQGWKRGEASERRQSIVGLPFKLGQGSGEEGC